MQDNLATRQRRQDNLYTRRKTGGNNLGREDNNTRVGSHGLKLKGKKGEYKIKQEVADKTTHNTNDITKKSTYLTRHNKQSFFCLFVLIH